jgi:hypothetical protein
MSETILTYGSSIVHEDGLLVSLHDRHGSQWIEANWNGKRLERARLRLPHGGTIQIQPEVREHAVLGLCDGVVVNGRLLTLFSAVDWADPKCIPAMDAPGRLPSGAGSSILNFLAYQSIRSLQYHGPYPTAALFDTLASSFRVQGTAAHAFQTFTSDVEAIALAGKLRKVPVDFQPAPFEWLDVGDAAIYLRDGVEKITTGGCSYTLSHHSSRRLRTEGDSIVAYVDMGGEPWVDIVRCSREGRLEAGPFDVPAFEHVLNGEPVPHAMVSLIGAVIMEEAPELLKPAVQEILNQTSWSFGDTGGDTVAAREKEMKVHSLLVERLAARSPERFLKYIVEGARPLLLGQAQALLLKGVSGSG